MLYLANSGVPLFTGNLYYQVILLIPIIAVEAYALKKLLEISVLKAIFVSLINNILSTIIGFFVWFLLLFLLAFIVPMNTMMTDSNQVLNRAVILLLIPMFFLSWFLEFYTALASFRFSREKLNKAVFQANFYSYLMLEVFAIVRACLGRL